MRHAAKLLAAALWVSAPVLCHGADVYKSEYRLSQGVGAPNAWGLGTERFIDLVREKTAGRINIKMYVGSSLAGGDGTKEFTLLRQGAIDLVVGSTLTLSPVIKEMNLFALPFLVTDAKASDALIHGPVGKRLFAVIESKGVIPLAWGENGLRQIMNSKHAVRTPDDMKGLKMRVVGSPVSTEAYEALGANPTQMSWADAQPAIATGAVDGLENAMPIMQTSKLWALGLKHLTLWNASTDELAFMVNKEVWSSWTPADQQAVRDAAEEAALYQIGLARKGMDDAALTKLFGENGVTVSILSEHAKTAFVKATRQVYFRWRALIGEELVGAAEQSIADSRR